MNVDEVDVEKQFTIKNTMTLDGLYLMRKRLEQQRKKRKGKKRCFDKVNVGMRKKKLMSLL